MYTSTTLVYDLANSPGEAETVVSDSAGDVSVRFTGKTGDVCILMTEKAAGELKRKLNDYLVAAALRKGVVK